MMLLTLQLSVLPLFLTTIAFSEKICPRKKRELSDLFQMANGLFAGLSPYELKHG
jgi:hypothetical protein